MTTEFGTRLRQARKMRGLTQTALSKLVGIPQSTISSAESEGNTSVYTAQLAQGLGISAHWLATGEGDMQAQAPAADDRAHQITGTTVQRYKPKMDQQLQQLYDAFLWFADHITDERQKRAALASCVHVMNRFFLESQGVQGVEIQTSEQHPAPSVSAPNPEHAPSR